jgi:hypothetical protein
MLTEIQKPTQREMEIDQAITLEEKICRLTNLES